MEKRRAGRLELLLLPGGGRAGPVGGNTGGLQARNSMDVHNNARTQGGEKVKVEQMER
jgi:hypothetical protein